MSADIRNDVVPRYLFRMFTSQSGGGPELATNNATEVVPRGFMNDRRLPSLYTKMEATNNAMEVVPRGFMNDRRLPSLYTKMEATVYEMVQSHYLHNSDVLTEFSSWAASIHAVLFLARHAALVHNPQVAMLDRERLEGEVIIFWVPDVLDGKRRDVEYLAHGCIRGRGYTAVPFEQLDFNRLYSLCPQISRSKENKKKAIDFGHKLRKKMLSSTPVVVSDGDIKTAKRLGLLFGELSVPATVALLRLQPRKSTGYQDVAMRVIQSLGFGEAECRSLATGYWCQTGAVHTHDTNGSTARRYRDVREWIKLLRTISNHEFSRTGEKCKRVESDAEYDFDTESDTDIDEYSNRVRRPYDLRSRPTMPTAKKAEADEYDLKWFDEEDVGDEEMEEESDEEMIDVKDRSEKEMFEEDIDEEDLNGRLPDGTMQDGDLSDSSDTVMTDETIRPLEGRNYVCVPSWEPRRLGVIVVIMDEYGNVMG